MKIRVIKSNPLPGQNSIHHLVGKEFDVLDGHRPLWDDGDGAVSVESKKFGGVIRLNKDEYEVVG